MNRTGRLLLLFKIRKGIFVIFFFFIFCFAFSRQFSFLTYSIEQGLSQSVVNCIIQDSKGFIWIGTQHGLNKFDGFTFQAYTFNPLDTTSISNNWIFSIDEDKNGNLWVATKGGVNEFIRSSKTFKRFQFNTGSKTNLGSNPYDAIVSRKGRILINMAPVLVVYDPIANNYTNYISKIEYDGSVKDNKVPLIEDTDGLVWIGSTRGLSCFDPRTEKFTYFFDDPSNPNSVSNNNITALFEDNARNIWIGTSDGLNIYNKSARTFRHYFSSARDKFTLSNNFIRAIVQDKSGNIWIGTEGGGLNKLMSLAGDQVFFENFTSEINGLSHNIVNALKVDKSENLWIGTLKGISKADLKKQKFNLFRKSVSPNSVNLLGNVIASIFKDDDGNIWVGNWGQGLNILNRKSGEVEHFSSHLPGNHYLVNDFVHNIFYDSEKRIWIGTRDGILIYKKETNSFVRFNEFFRNPALPDFRGLRINKIIQDNRKNYWIATQNGLYKLNLPAASFERFTKESDDAHRVSGNLIYCILEDRQGKIWIATLSGLDVYDAAAKKITHFQKVQGTENSLSDNFVISLCEDHKGNIWIGTGSCVNEFVKKDSAFRYFSHENGLPNDQVFEILEDNSRNLWFATGSGLSRYDSLTGSFRTYTVEEGLQSLEFNLRAAFKSKDGEVFFGGMNGFNSFYPDSLHDNKFIPEIVFTSFNKTNSKGVNETIDPENLNEIVLHYNDYSFTIEFAALEFTHPEKNKYAYMLEGITDKWIPIGNRRFVPFSNLPPGEYTLKVKASNNDGVWNEAGRSLKIIIQPPWWKSFIAYCSYFIAIILIVYLYINWRMRRLIREKNLLEKKVHERTLQIEKQNNELMQSREELDLINKELEHRVELRTSEYLLAKEKAESGDRLKTAFMHNISHEIRTPLNGILGFGQMMLEKDIPIDERERYLEVLERSSGRLLNTITDYMDISLIVSENMDVRKKRLSPVALLNERYEKFLDTCNSKNLAFTLEIPAIKAPFYINSDEELLAKALDHLIDNAIKFTEQGSVVFGFALKGTELEFFVKDTGMGISAEDQQFVFDHFAQADSSNIRIHEGSGLGLSIAKGLAELLQGRITLDSEKGKGSSFILTIPLEILNDEPGNDRVIKAGRKKEKSLVLIVEDEESNKMFLAKILQKEGIDFLVVSDGRKAVEACRQNPLITLVLMDIKMPVMNGYTATTEIKAFAPDLPVIAITAYAQSGDKQKAFDAGCNDYLSKPVSKDALLEKLKIHGMV